MKTECQENQNIEREKRKTGRHKDRMSKLYEDRKTVKPVYMKTGRHKYRKTVNQKE